MFLASIRIYSYLSNLDLERN